MALSHSTISIKPVCSSNVEKMAAREAFQLVEVPQLVALETSKVSIVVALSYCLIIGFHGDCNYGYCDFLVGIGKDHFMEVFK